MRDPMRAVGWVLMLTGAVLIVAAVAQPMVDAIELIGGAVTAVAGAGIELFSAEADLLADHPDEDEERRRRGAAGWQKPVRPPRDHELPGGLPPRR